MTLSVILEADINHSCLTDLWNPSSFGGRCCILLLRYSCRHTLSGHVQTMEHCSSTVPDATLHYLYLTQYALAIIKYYAEIIRYIECSYDSHIMQI